MVSVSVKWNWEKWFCQSAIMAILQFHESGTSISFVESESVSQSHSMYDIVTSNSKVSNLDWNYIQYDV